MARRPWDGVLNIIRFNWPMFAIAIVALLTSFAVAVLSPRAALSSVAWLATAGMFCGLVVPLVVSHLIYDRSDLYRWAWLTRALHGATTDHATLCHAGFDETSALLRERFADTEWLVLDHFDPVRMTEPSIQRARRRHPPLPETLTAPFGAWPVAAASTDVVIGLLAVHELRAQRERVQWFAEAARALRPHGRVVLVEHVRDWANLLAFGPGALHFHSVSAWRSSWERAGFHSIDAFRVTPWVRVFVLRAQP